MDLAGVDEPNVVAFISNELSLHLEDLLLAHFLHIEAYLEALDVSVSLELPLLQEGQLIYAIKLSIVYLIEGSILAGFIEWCLKVHSDGIRLSLLIGKDTSLNVIDDLGVE